MINQKVEDNGAQKRRELTTGTSWAMKSTCIPQPAQPIFGVPHLLHWKGD